MKLTITIILYVVFLLLSIPAKADSIRLKWLNDPNKVELVNAAFDRSNKLSEPVPYVNLVDFSLRMGFDYKLDRTGERIRINFPVHNAIFTAYTPFVYIDGNMRQMTRAMLPPHDGLFAPLEALVSLLPELYPGEILFDPSSNELLVAPPSYDLFGVKYVVVDNETHAIIPARRGIECQYSTDETGQARLFFTGATINTILSGHQAGEGHIEAVRIETSALGTELIFTPDSGAVFDRLDKANDPPLYVAVFKGGSFKAVDPDAAKRLEDEKDAWAFDVVVIDPGHGGKDPGAVGHTKTKEKDIVLDVALRLRDALNKKGIKTVMTRDSDKFVSLGERTRLANKVNGKMFISLHCNANKDKRAHGSETYFLSPTKTERAMRVAELENNVIQMEEDKNQYADLNDPNYIILSMAQAQFVQESQALAAMFQEMIPEKVGIKDRGVDQAGFYVLVGASMPAILFEMGFITNTKEETKLKDKQFRQKLAEEIGRVVVKFLEKEG